MMAWFWTTLFLVCGQLLRFVTSVKDVPMTTVEALSGEPAHLPCDISTSEQGDHVILVLWYREDMGTPIYSVDVRDRDLSVAERWSDDAVFGSRAYFLAERTPGQLAVERVRPADAGLYRCRVDFRVAQTRNSKVLLSVVVPPHRIVIKDEAGVDRASVVGPYNEGDSLTLTCHVFGGSPVPRVAWYRDDTALTTASRSASGSGGPSAEVRAELHIPSLSRADLHSELSCRASNSNRTQPTIATVHLDMNFPPLDVRILGANQPLSAGRRYDLLCQSAGSRPPAKLTWWRDGQRLDKTKETTSNNGNQTTSTLSFLASKSDAGRRLTCRAENPSVHQEPIDDSWRLQIQYLPETEVKLGTNLDPNVIREGSDVYFDCKVDAVPPVYKVEWRYNGRPLPHNVGQGVIISNLSLVLQGVSRTTAGNYTCVGFNAEGDAPSKPFQLNVLFAPTCRPNQPRVHGVAKQERARVRCSVEANPPQVTFRWTFNNSAESIEVAAAHVARARSEDPTGALDNMNGATYVSSVVTYTPVTELDYGTLLCWATNSIGSQRVPCVYHIIAAGRPDQVHNCTVTNVSLTSLTVRCSAGFDGGLPQSFLLEAQDSGTRTIKANLTSPVPRFAVAGLNPGGRYLIGVYAFNTKGRGEPVILPAATLRLPEKQLTSEKEPRRNLFFRMTPALSLTIGAILAIITVALLVAAMLRLQRRCRGGAGASIDGAAPKHGEPASPGPSDKSDTMTSGGGVHAALLMTATGKDANGGGAAVACPDDGLQGGGDERGPDVVADAEGDEQADFLRRQPTVATIAAPRGGSPVISQCCRIGGINMNIPPSPLQRIPPGEQHMILNNQTLYPARAIPRHMWPSYGGGVAGVTNMYHGPPPSHVNAVTSIPMRPLPRNSISRPMTSLTEEDNSSDLTVKRESTV